MDHHPYRKDTKHTITTTITITMITPHYISWKKKKKWFRLLVLAIVTIAMTWTSASASASALSPSSPVAVIGATGRLGRWAVQELVDRGIPCHLLVRNMPPHASSSAVPKSLQDCESSEQVLLYFQSLPNVSLMQGDVSDVEALTSLVADCSACLALWGATRRSKFSDLWNHRTVEDSDPTHAKQVNYQGVVNLIQACQASQSKCKRIVRITGFGEDPKGFFTILINLLGSMAKAWNYQGEQALRSNAKDLEYTIVRPGVMSDDAPSPLNNNKDKKVAFQLMDNGAPLPVSRIRYSDIAKLCVDSLDASNNPAVGHCTLTAVTTPYQDQDQEGAATASSWKPLLAKVQPDRRSFPSDMREQHYAAVKGAIVTGVGGVSAVILAVIAKVMFF